MSEIPGMSVFDYDVDDGTREDARDEAARAKATEGCKPRHVWVECRNDPDREGYCRETEVSFEKYAEIRTYRDLPYCPECSEDVPF
jgi:hypothetical protein